MPLRSSDDKSKSRLPETIMAIAALLTAISSGLVGIVGLFRSSNATQIATEAGKVAATVATKEPVQDAQSRNGTFFLQLASYLALNCDNAQAEIDSYGEKFSPKPKIFLSPSAQLVIIAIKAKDLEQANSLKTKAHELGGESVFMKTDLVRSFVKYNPGWREIASCSEIKY